MNLLPAGRTLRVLTYPHAALRQRCAPVAAAAANAASPALALALDLLATVRAQHGLGLAAPQVGHAARLVALRVPAARTEQQARRLGRVARRALAARPPAFIVAANPRLVPLRAGDAMALAPAARRGAALLGYEACLSLPGDGSLVRRRPAVRLRYELVAASDPRILERLRHQYLGDADAEAETEPQAGVDPAAAPAPAFASAPSALALESEEEPVVGGVIVEELLEGLPAVVAQHELDHLDGVLISDLEVRHFLTSTLEREMEEAQMRFAQGLARYYADESACLA